MASRNGAHAHQVFTCVSAYEGACNLSVHGSVIRVDGFPGFLFLSTFVQYILLMSSLHQAIA